MIFEVRVSHLEKKRGKTAQISEVCVSSTGVRLCCPFFFDTTQKTVVSFSSQIEKVHMFDSNILVALLLMEKNPANQVGWYFKSHSHHRNSTWKLKSLKRSPWKWRFLLETHHFQVPC